jgi:integrase
LHKKNGELTGSNLKAMKNKNCRFAIDNGKGHELKDGSCAIVLHVKKERQRKMITLKLTAMPENWNSELQCFFLKAQKVKKKNYEFISKLHLDRKNNNTWLDTKKVECDQIIDDFDAAGIDWTLNQFEAKFLNIEKKTGVEAYFTKTIEELKASNHIGNARCYANCLHILKEHNPKFDKLVFNEIDLSYINRLHNYLYNERGCALNTIRYYMKAFRAILNKARGVHEASIVTYPFGDDGYKIKSEPTNKRYLPSEIIEILKTKEIENFHLNLYRNIFLFSYYSQGMAFVDMANLTKSDIVKEEGSKYIKYRRQKTESKGSEFIYVAISIQIQTLIDWFKSNNVLIGDYLLPIITIDGYKGEKFYQHVRDRLHRYNKNLKDLAKALEIEGINLTGYVSRHSYAMKLKNSDVSEDIISEALGHKDLKTTKTYLGSFAKKKISKANENL